VNPASVNKTSSRGSCVLASQHGGHSAAAMQHPQSEGSYEQFKGNFKKHCWLMHPLVKNVFTTVAT